MSINFKNVAFNYKGLPHQVAALEKLQRLVESKYPDLVNDDAGWVRDWRTPTATTPRPPTKYQITAQQLECITGYKAKYFNEAFLADLQALFDATGFDKHLGARQMLLAQMCHESAGFKYMKEIDRGWYLEGRTDLGNKYPGDGPKFRGCGPIQLTGRHNHQRFSDWMTKRGTPDPKIMELGTDYTADKYPFLSAVPWILNNGYLNVCKTGDVRYATRILNGGFNGLDDRIYYWNKVKMCVQA